ncbi:BREX-1 system adenine-specific DNA-methyltransferase PglX [Prevotella ihumii]|uniref:BREX-1 system adenine-specific DNA-methyltransferase PglX n=1 Tax=Prevotella ihumii TaxID=1917878 RepID=UPI00098111A1|nr:BREX-1 system adenine-specific DNA-methyltransferase PglX [Prevotella ihumii]
MATNTAALKTFAQQTRIKLRSLIATKMEYILTQDTAELRGFESQIQKLKDEIAAKGRDLVVEEVAYTWFNRVMALRFMDANEYTSPRVVTPGTGQMRPEILQNAMAGSVDEDLHLRPEDLSLPEAKLYRKLLVASCNAYGASMPFLFEHISDYTELLLPDDLLSEQSFVTDIRRGMTDEDCQNVEVMGWLYQFYITDRKADAETKKSKKGGLKSDEQAAATQLFTPHWVVRYMVENSLGRIWMTLHPESRLVDEMPYYIPTPEGQTDVIPEDIHSVKDIRLIDPCVGSGHIAVYAFDLFTKMYEEEGYQTHEIPAEILTHNIYGIDIDRRCYQLACFALTMKARAYHSRYLRRPVQPNVMALQTIDHDTIASTGDWSSKSTLWQMEYVDTIGSLLQISPEECAAIQVEEGLFVERQRMLKKQAEYLSGKYHCVVTNPPYLGKGMGDELKGYVSEHFPNSKGDVMATFMERCLELVSKAGKVGMINMLSWMFLSSYDEFRKDLLISCYIDSLLLLGAHAFDEISGEIVQCTTFILANHSSNSGSVFFRLIGGKCSADKESTFLKAKKDQTDNIYYSNISKEKFEDIPGYRLGFWLNKKLVSIWKNQVLNDDNLVIRQGLASGSNERFIRLWHEINSNTMGFEFNSINEAIESSKKWFPYNKGGDAPKWFGNNYYVLSFDENSYNALSQMGNRLPSRHLYFKEGLAFPRLGNGHFNSRFTPKGFIFDCNAPMGFAETDLLYKLAYLNSKAIDLFLSVLCPTLTFQVGDVRLSPYTKDKNNEVEKHAVDCISISKQDWDSHETSWDFQQNELLSLIGQSDEDLKHLASLQAACTNVNVLLSDLVDKYHTKWTALFMQLHTNEEELNRQFIDIYDLQDELTPDVPLNEITILQKGEIDIEDGEIVWNDAVIIKQLISYLVGCFMGRYSVDRPGLIIASQHQDLTSLGLKVEGIDNGAEGRLLIDDDGIVPILEGEYFNDDMTVRIEGAIKTLFGEAHFQENLKYLEQTLGKSLRDYLFKDFFANHIDGKMYQKRPIYWLFSSKMGDKNKKGYFKALVYMHRIESDTLSKLHADYVTPYIDKIEQQKREAEDQAVRDDLSQAQRNKATKQADEYAAALREVREFATILAQMSTQRLTIDLDDGVRVNYPKYYPLVEPIKGLDKSED